MIVAITVAITAARTTEDTTPITTVIATSMDNNEHNHLETWECSVFPTGNHWYYGTHDQDWKQLTSLISAVNRNFAKGGGQIWSVEKGGRGGSSM